MKRRLTIRKRKKIHKEVRKGQSTGWKIEREEGIKEEKMEANGIRNVTLRKMDILIGLCFVKPCVCHTWQHCRVIPNKKQRTAGVVCYLQNPELLYESKYFLRKDINNSEMSSLSSALSPLLRGISDQATTAEDPCVCGFACRKQR
jgi:hypothetical protein